MKTLLALTTAAFALAAPAASATQRIVPPPLPGRTPVGTTTLHLIDPSRSDPSFVSGKRELMVQLWYPASRATGPLAPYMPAKQARLFARLAGLAPTVITSIRTRAHLDATIAPGRHPVILYSPGSSEMRSDATALVENLASSGYVVVTIDHTHESELVQFPDGKIVRGSFGDTGAPSNTRAVTVRVADVRIVLGRLAQLNRAGHFVGRLDLAHTGMFGFSPGGATAAAAMLVDPRIKAGADLDGSLYGPVRKTGLTRPFLEPRVLAHDPSIKPFSPTCRAPATPTPSPAAPTTPSPTSLGSNRSSPASHPGSLGP
jgi:predicted dienelactone hydrolase